MDNRSRVPGLLKIDEAESISSECSGNGKRLVLTNGCFDLLHVGHLRYLQEAKSMGDILIVAINSDDSVRRLKGPSRPLVPAPDRAELVAALKCVDYTLIFEEDTAEFVVGRVKPCVYVKGGDYTVENCPEARLVVGYGGEVGFIRLVPGRSTSGLVEKATRA